MTREAALLGTPTYTVFLAELAAVDAELIRRGLIVDLREPGELPVVAKKPAGARQQIPGRSDSIYEIIVRTLEASATSKA